MGKELECLDRIDKRNYLTEREHKEFLGVVEKALTEYEAIKNVNPSEALEELNILRHLEIGFDKNGNPITLNDMYGLPIIKQALLKAQEQELHIGGRLSNKEILYLKQSIEQCNDKPIFYISRTYGNKYIVPQKQFDDLIKENTELRQKVQEPKQYLKWEDLEFEENKHNLKCKMNDSLYYIEWFIDGMGFKTVNIYLDVNKDYLEYCIYLQGDKKQFFNDLHLERVE